MRDADKIKIVKLPNNEMVFLVRLSQIREMGRQITGYMFCLN